MPLSHAVNLQQKPLKQAFQHLPHLRPQSTFQQISLQPIPQPKSLHSNHPKIHQAFQPIQHLISQP